MNIVEFHSVKNGEIFLSGETMLDHFRDGNLENYKWVAKKGDGANDWALYYSFFPAEHINFPLATDQRVASHGTKMCNIKKAQELTSCNDDVIKLYRR
jgi:hypothetical protein